METEQPNTEQSKTEQNQTENNANNANSASNNPFQSFMASDNPLAKLLSIVNEPAIANVGLGAFIYWVVDPKGLKKTMEDVKKDTEQLLKASKLQTEEIELLKAKIKRLTKQSNPIEKAHHLNGKPAAKSGTGHFDLD